MNTEAMMTIGEMATTGMGVETENMTSKINMTEDNNQ
jgi:hypothetical protein